VVSSATAVARYCPALLQGAVGGATQHHKKRKNRKRKRLPKGYDPALPNGGLPPPDPERWLPKWQRSDAKKRKLKSAARDKGVAKGSQGAGKVDEALDRTKASASTAATGGKPSVPSKPSLPSRSGRKGSKK
jgi:signal recognition particle subunit SRP72